MPTPPRRVRAVCPSPPMRSACRVSQPCLFIVMSAYSLTGSAMKITTSATIGSSRMSPRMPSQVREAADAAADQQPGDDRGDADRRQLEPAEEQVADREPHRERSEQDLQHGDLRDERHAPEPALADRGEVAAVGVAAPAHPLLHERAEGRRGTSRAPGRSAGARSCSRSASTSQVRRPSSPAMQRRPRKNSFSRCSSTGSTAVRRYTAVRPERHGTAPARPIAGT